MAGNLHQNRRLQSRKTKPSILDNPLVIERLEIAFNLGATQAEAAQFAHISESALKKHLAQRTEIRLVDGRVENLYDLMMSWKSHLCLLAKKKIYDRIADPDDPDTRDAWRVLERRQPDEYGGVCVACSKRARSLR